MCIFFSSKYSNAKPGVVANACSPSMREVEAGELLWVRGQPELHSKFLSSLGYSDPIKREIGNWLKRCKAWLWGCRLRQNGSYRPLSPPKAGWGVSRPSGVASLHTFLDTSAGKWAEMQFPLPRGPPCSGVVCRHTPVSGELLVGEPLQYKRKQTKTDVCSSCQVPFLHFRNHSTSTGRVLLISFRWWMTECFAPRGTSKIWLFYSSEH